MDDSTDLARVWTRAVSRFDDNTIRPHHKAWIGLTRPVGLVEDTALIAAPNEFARDYLENRLRPLIASVLSDELGREIHVAVTVQPQDEPNDANDFFDSVSGEPEDRLAPDSMYDEWTAQLRSVGPNGGDRPRDATPADRESRLNRDGGG